MVGATGATRFSDLLRFGHRSSGIGPDLRPTRAHPGRNNEAQQGRNACCALLRWSKERFHTSKESTSPNGEVVKPRARGEKNGE